MGSGRKLCLCQEFGGFFLQLILQEGISSVHPKVLIYANQRDLISLETTTNAVAATFLVVLMSSFQKEVVLENGFTDQGSGDYKKVGI